jgi:hypothetical protein
MDLANREIIDYCIGVGGTQPIWSPNGEQIAVGILKSRSSPYTTVILDLRNVTAIELAQLAYPVGWVD